MCPFLEHVAFGGTTHFPKRSLVEYLESLGMKYGQDINAFTGFDRTIYMFAVPADHQKEEVIDRSLLIMRDWLDGISMSSEKVENEKELYWRNCVVMIWEMILFVKDRTGDIRTPYTVRYSGRYPESNATDIGGILSEMVCTFFSHFNSCRRYFSSRHRN